MSILHTPRRVLHIHNLVAQAEELLAHDRLSEEVGHVLISRNEGHTQLPVFHALANEVVTSLNVLRFGVVFWVVREVDG